MAVEVMVVAEIVVAEVANVFVAASDKRDTSSVPPRREKPFKVDACVITAFIYL